MPVEIPISAGVFVSQAGFLKDCLSGLGCFCQSDWITRPLLMNQCPLSRLNSGHLWLVCILLSQMGSVLGQGSAPQGNQFGEIPQLVQLGSPVSLVASVSSDSPMTFSWTKDGRPVRDADTMTLTLPAVTKESAGTYRLKARNAFGFWESPSFLVAVYETGMAEVTLVAGKSLRLEPHAWGPGLKYSWIGNGLESTPSRQQPIFQIDRMPQGIQSAGLYLMMGETGPEASGFGYRIKSVGKPRAPTAERVRWMRLNQAYLEQGYLPSDEIPVTFHAKGLPPGITINATTGDISGSPTVAGDYQAELWTSDGYGTSPRSQQIDFVGSSKIDLFTRTYSGTLYQLPVINGQSGYLGEMTVTPNGSFSCKLTFKSRVIRLSGKFTGNESAFVAQVEKVVQGLNLKMTLQPAVAVLCEWIDPSGEIETTSAMFNVVYRRTGDAYVDPAGRHVVLLQPEKSGEVLEAEDVMRGTGFGSLQVNANFSTSFVGTLPDGQGITCSSYVTTGGTVPTFIIPQTRRDLLIGNMKVPTRYDGFYPQSVWWYRDANPRDPIAPAGWSRNLLTSMTPYTPPKAGQLLLPSMESRPNNAYLSLSAAGRDLQDSTAFIDADFSLSMAHTARFAQPNSNKLSVSFYAPTGFFTGQVTLDDPRRSIGFRGMMFPNTDIPHGEGFFLAPPPKGTVSATMVSGQVWIGATFGE